MWQRGKTDYSFLVLFSLQCFRRNTKKWNDMDNDCAKCRSVTRFPAIFRTWVQSCRTIPKQWSIKQNHFSIPRAFQLQHNSLAKAWMLWKASEINVLIKDAGGKTRFKPSARKKWRIRVPHFHQNSRGSTSKQEEEKQFIQQLKLTWRSQASQRQGKDWLAQELLGVHAL